MKIRLTARGMALVKNLKPEAGTLKASRPDFRMFTLIKIDSRGRVISRKKVMVNVNKYFKAS